MRLKGTKKDYDIQFHKGLNIIAGPISTGKSTILQLIDYCLGNSKHPEYEELRKVSSVFLEIEIKSEILTIERKLFIKERKRVKIHYTTIEKLDIQHNEKVILSSQKKYKDSISSFILSKLNLWGIHLKEAPTKESSGADIMSIRDLMWFCYLNQGRIDDQEDFLFEKSYMKNIKLKQVFKVIFDVYDEQEAKLRYQLRENEEMLKVKKRQLESIEEFLRINNISKKESLILKKKRLKEKLNKRKKKYNNLTGELLEKTEFSREFRKELKTLERKISEKNERLREKRILKDQINVLIGQYEEDIFRIEALIEAKKILDPLSIKKCPICLNDIGIIRANKDTCPICSKNLIYEEESEEFIKPTTELSRSKKKYKEIQEVLDELSDEIDKLEFKTASLNIEFKKKSKELEHRIESIISPLNSLREHFSANIIEFELKINEIQEKIRYYKNLEPLEKEISDLKDNKKDLKDKLDNIDKSGKTYKDIIGELSKRFFQVLNAFNYPKLNRRSYINEKLEPFARNTHYSKTGSFGGTVLITQAWFVAIFELFEDYDVNHPKFFLLDSPQSNIGSGSNIEEDYRDENIIKAIYKKYKSLIEREILEQIIIVDKFPPKSHETSICVRFTGIRGKYPYGLIDDETGKSQIDFSKWSGPIRNNRDSNLGGVFQDGGIVSVAFHCRKCGELLYGKYNEIPKPDMFAETAAESRRFNSQEIYCPKCNKSYNIVIDSSLIDWDISIEGLPGENEFYYLIDEE